MDALADLRTLTVPTLANAIEVFDVRPANTGYTTRPLTCQFPAFSMCVGYAVTLQATTNRAPETAPPPIDEPEYWRWLATIEGPKVRARDAKSRQHREKLAADLFREDKLQAALRPHAEDTEVR